MNIRILIGVCCIMTNVANATFLIDMQDYKQSNEKTEQRYTPDGYTVLTGKYHGVVHELGEGEPFANDSFGENFSLQDALSFILPEDWFAYIDETLDAGPSISWDAQGQDWLTVLATIGRQYGYRFIVDWDQELVQITRSADYETPNYNAPVIVEMPDTGKEIFIYSNKEKAAGFILVDGKYVPVKTS